MRAVIFDLDGVIRQFDRSRAHEVARRHRIPVESLVRTSFETSRLRRLVTGELTRAAWVVEIGEALGCPAAADDWLTGNIGAADPQVVAVVDEVRRAGVPTAILTNGTDTTDEELRELGIRDCFDVVVSTWELGVAKPEPRAFELACARVGVAPADAFFTDDRADNVAAAMALGMAGHRFEGVTGLRDALEAWL